MITESYEKNMLSFIRGCNVQKWPCTILHFRSGMFSKLLYTQVSDPKNTEKMCNFWREGELLQYLGQDFFSYKLYVCLKTLFSPTSLTCLLPLKPVTSAEDQLCRSLHISPSTNLMVCQQGRPYSRRMCISEGVFLRDAKSSPLPPHSS